MPMIKGCRAVVNHVFTLEVTDLTANRVINRMFGLFEKSFVLEIKPPEWNLPLVLKSHTCPPYWLMKLSTDKHLHGKLAFS